MPTKSTTKCVSHYPELSAGRMNAGYGTFNFIVHDDRIWFEDARSKEQWSYKVSKEDSMLKNMGMDTPTLMNLIATGLKNLSEEKKNGECEATLAPNDSGNLLLTMSFQLSMNGCSWRPSFPILLEKLELTEVELLAAQVRDLQAKVSDLESTVKSYKKHKDAKAQFVRGCSFIAGICLLVWAYFTDGVVIVYMWCKECTEYMVSKFRM